MGRFIRHRYTPAQDCSPGYDDLGATEVTLVVALRDEGSSCACGCGEFPANPSSTFKIGHDAKLKGKLIRAHLTDTPVIMIVGDHTYAPKTALEVAADHNWERYLHEAATRAAGIKPLAAVDIDPVEVQKLCDAAISEPVTHPRKVTIKVGRWHYTGNVVVAHDDGTADVEYVTKKGEVRTANNVQWEA